MSKIAVEEMPETSTEVVAYSPIEAALGGLAQKYTNLVFDVSTSQGLVRAKEAYKDINQYSIKLEAARQKEKAASLAYGRFVDSEAKRIAERLDALRFPIKEQIETETKRAQREEEARKKAEEERIAADERAKKEAEEKRMVEERAEIERKRAELEREERDRRAKIEAEERAARERIAESERQERLARQAREEVERIKLQAEEDRLRAEREKIETDRRAAEEAARKLREAEEAKARAERMEKEEVERKVREAKETKSRAEEAEKQAHMDGLDLLAQFVSRFGKRKEFAVIAGRINEFLVTHRKEISNG